jgi:hypothetical protein
MADEEKNVNVEELTAKIQALTATVEQLSARLTQPSPTPAAATPGPSPPPQKEETESELTEVTEELLSWASRAALLPRVSTLCFLLVVALGLRTLTDNNILDTLIGSALGMGYAAIIMLVGWYKYGKESPLAPIFVACGAALMAIIVVETHTRFQSIPLVPAYFTLMATGIAMAVISYRYNVIIPISVGTLGMCLAGAAIDYPNPFFPYLAMILWTANMLGFFAAVLRRCSWLRWTVLLVSVLMLHLWGVKLSLPLGRHEEVPVALALPWFLPVLSVFALTYPALALAGIVRSSGTDTITRFDKALPTINGFWAFSAAYLVVSAGSGSTTLLGGVGVACALAHFGAAFWMAGRGTAGSRGANAFIFAGLAMMALTLTVATGKFSLSLPALAIVSFWLFIIARQWRNGGTRIISYIGQIYAAAALAIYLQSHSTAATDFLTTIPAGLLAVIGFSHYHLARRTATPAGPNFFTRFDQKDRSASLILLGALASAFFAVRVLVYNALILLPGNINHSYRCAQSIIINLSAAGLMLFAIRRRNREVRNVAILVTFVGAVNVFLYDLILTRGMPLVLSVFTFGLVAALESIALGRWPRTSPEIADAEPDTIDTGTHDASRP